MCTSYFIFAFESYFLLLKLLQAYLSFIAFHLPLLYIHWRKKSSIRFSFFLHSVNSRSPYLYFLMTQVQKRRYAAEFLKLHWFFVSSTLSRQIDPKNNGDIFFFLSENLFFASFPNFFSVHGVSTAESSPNKTLSFSILFVIEKRRVWCTFNFIIACGECFMLEKRLASFPTLL